MTGILPALGKNQFLIIPESKEKIVCDNSTGKENFIGFSVHNDRTIGRADAVCSKNIFINFYSTVIIGPVHARWTKSPPKSPPGSVRHLEPRRSRIMASLAAIRSIPCR